jgi:hypothetical protein
MKNGPKIAIVLVCLLAAIGLFLYNSGVIGGKSSSSSAATTATGAAGTTGGSAAGDKVAPPEDQLAAPKPLRSR